jgi:hypothetical protein
MDEVTEMALSPEAGRIDVSSEVRDALPFTQGGHYEVAYVVPRPPGNTLDAEHWARATFEEAPRGLRWFLIGGWTALTCRLRPSRSPERVIGWHIEDKLAQMVVTSVQAWVGINGVLVFTANDDTVSVSSTVRYTRHHQRPAKLAWGLTTPLHERILPHLLTMAARRHSG